MREPKNFFTIIEMLIVIAIIAILAALLAPSLRKALNRARDLGCLNNLRQIGAAIYSYTGDNRGRFPTAGGYTNGKGSMVLYWQDYLAPYCGISVDNIYSKCFIEKHYVGKVVVFRGKGPLSCPAVTDEFILKKDIANGSPNGGRCTQNSKFDVGYNQYLDMTRVREVLDARRTFAFMDMCSDNGTGVQPASSGHLKKWGGTGGKGWYAWPMYNWSDPRHGNADSLNICYVDGHAAMQFYYDIPDTISQTTYQAGIWFKK